MAAKRAKNIKMMKSAGRRPRFTSTKAGSRPGAAVLRDVQAKNLHYKDMAATWKTWEEWLRVQQVDPRAVNAATIYDYLRQRLESAKRPVKGARIMRWRHHLEVSSKFFQPF